MLLRRDQQRTIDFRAAVNLWVRKAYTVLKKTADRREAMGNIGDPSIFDTDREHDEKLIWAVIDTGNLKLYLLFIYYVTIFYVLCVPFVK